MSLEPGQIIGTDLSPTANILGTQIADKTLQFRNFTEAVFKIVSTGSATTPSGSPTTAAGYYAGTLTTTVAHNLGFVPMVIGAIKIGSTYYMLPTTTVITDGSSYQKAFFRFAVDSTNVYIGKHYNGFGNSVSDSTTYSVVYYLLQQTSN